MLQFLVTMQTLLAERLDRRDDKGATLVEYGLLVGLIAIVSIAVITTLGTSIKGIFTTIATAVDGAAAKAN